MKKLPVESQELAAAWEKAWYSYIEDPALYKKHLPEFSARDVPVALIDPSHTMRLLECGVIEWVEHDEVKAPCKFFLTLELLKKRYRLINHPVHHNDLIPDADPVTFNTLRWRRQLVHKGPCAVERDFKAYYHQGLLSEEVRNFFCVRAPLPDGTYRLARLRVAPMGQKHMVKTFSAATDLLLSYRKSCTTDTQIDNVLFVGKKDDLLNDVPRFFDRCDQAGVTFNDDTEDVASLITDKIEWLGMSLNFSDKTIKLTEKFMAKLKTSWEGRLSWTWSGFASHVGLLWWSMQVLRAPVTQYFNLFRFISSTSQKMQEARDSEWHRPASLTASAWIDIERWTDSIMKNDPVPVREDKEHEVLVLIDAAKNGWGYVAWDKVTNKVYQHGEKWGHELTNKFGANCLHRSCTTESWAVNYTKKHLLPQIARSNPSLLIGSDNTPTVFNYKKRFSTRSYAMNSAINNDECSYPSIQADIVHVPGKENVLADAKSRGIELFGSAVIGDEVIIDSLRRLLGDIPADQYQCDGGGEGEDAIPNPQNVLYCFEEEEED